MSSVVLDASALLTIVNHEPGMEKLTPHLLRNSTCSTVNLAEVQSKLVIRGLTADDAWEATVGPIREAAAFTAEHARIAGSLVAQTRPFGLSRGDRALLAFGLPHNAPV